MIKKILSFFRYISVNKKAIDAIKKDEKIIKNLDKDKKSYIKKIEEIDERIIRIQNSTRTTIPALGAIHDRLRMRWGWYYNWHTRKISDVVHVVALAIYIACLCVGAYLFLRGDFVVADSQKVDPLNKTLVAKDDSGVLLASEGEEEVIEKRTENFKTFDKGNGEYRISGGIGKIHYKSDPYNESELFKEINLYLKNNKNKKGGDCDYYLDQNGYQIKIWNKENVGGEDVYYVAQFERAGQNIKMSPVALAWENEEGEYQEISKPKSDISPVIDNERHVVTWENAFGDGLHFSYNISPDKFFKTVRVDSKESLPPATINDKGLKLTIVMSVAWSDVEAENGFAKENKNKKIDHEYKKDEPKNQSVEDPAEFAFEDSQDRDLWWMQQPVGWDSSEQVQFFNMDWSLERLGDSNFMKLSADSEVVYGQDKTYPIYLDTAISEEQVGSSYDDSNASDDMDWFYDMDFLYLGTEGYYYNFTTWTKFSSIPIPNASTITDASLSFKSYSTRSTSGVDLEISGFDADSAVSPEDGLQLRDYVDSEYSETEATVFWDDVASWSANTWYDSPSIGSVVQEIVDRPGWIEDNDMGFMTNYNGSTDYRDAYAYDYAGNTSGPKFNATYTEASSGISVSGTCKQYDQSANCADSQTVKVAVNGTIQAQTGTISSGGWSITGVTEPTSGDVVTVFVDGVDDDKEAVAVTKWDGSGDISGINLYERHLSIGSDDNQTITNANLGQYDNSVSSDEDIFVEVDSNNDLTIPASSTSTYSDQEIIIKASNTYRPDSSSSGNITAPNLEIPSSATLTADANTITLTDDSTPFTKAGTFNYDTSTFKYTAEGATNITATTYYNLETKPSGESTGSSSWAVSGAGSTDFNGTYIENGTYNTLPAYSLDSTHWLIFEPSGMLEDRWILSNQKGSGTEYYYCYTTDLPGSSWGTTSGTAPAPTVSAGSSPYTYTLASGTINVEGGYVNGDGTNGVILNADTNDPTLNINGSFTNSAGATFTASASGSFSVASNFTNNSSATFTHSSGTITFDGQGEQSITVNSDPLNNLTVTNASASGVVFTDSLTVAGTFTNVTAGSKLTFDALSTYAFANININGQAVGTKITMVSNDPTNPDLPSRQWYFNVSQSSPSVSYVNVTDSDANGGNAITPISSTDGGNNENWLFNISPTEDSLTFINPYGGVGNVAVSDNTTEWTFRALVSDEDGPTDIDYVLLRFANNSDNSSPFDALKFKWTESSDTFSEEADVLDAASIVSTSDNSNSSDNQWTLDFKIKFNSNFLLLDNNYAIELYVIDEGSAEDMESYADIYQVKNLYLTLGLDSPSVDFSNLLPGATATDTTVVTVTTNYHNGYTLSASDDVAGDGSAMLHSDALTRILDYAGTISIPTIWDGTGLGICVYAATDKDAKWGTGSTETSTLNKYAGVPQNATQINAKTGSPTDSDQTSIGYKIVAPNTQKTGDYSGNLTFTATGALN